MEKHINPNREIKEGVMVRWSEFPDRLYIVEKTGIQRCGREDFCRIESVDHKWLALVPKEDLTWDDVDYIEIG